MNHVRPVSITLKNYVHVKATLGWRKMEQLMQLELFQETLGKIWDSLQNKDEIMKNFLNHQNFDVRPLCSPKKINDLLVIEFRNVLICCHKKTFIHIVSSNKKKWLCLLFVGGLADQAGACLNVWEVMLYPGQTSGLSELWRMLKCWVCCHKTCSDSL